MSGDEPPVVSVVIPTRDSASLIEECLASLSRGHEAPLEAIVVDQASEDRTTELAARAGALVVPRGRPDLYAPPTASRNAGAAVARGEFLLHLDADMTVRPGAIDAAIGLARAAGHVAVVFEEIDIGDGIWAGAKAFERELYRGTRLEGARFVRASTFAKVGGYDDTLGSGEDWDIHARYEAEGSIGRQPLAVEHHLGRVSLTRQLVKKFDYGRSAGSFVRKRGASEWSGAMLAAYRGAFPMFARHPLNGLAFIALRSGEVVSLLAGLAISRRHASSAG